MDCRRFGCVLLAGALAGCFTDPPSSGSSSDGSSGGGGSSGEPTTTGVEPTTSPGDESSSTGFFPLTSTTTGGVLDTGCEGEVEEVPGRHAPIDLVVVVDSTGSMADKAVDVLVLLDALSLGVVDELGDDIAHLALLYDTSDPLGLCELGPAGEWCSPTLPSHAWVDAETSAPDFDVIEAMVEVLIPGVENLRTDAQKHLVVVSDFDTALAPEEAMMQILAIGPEYFSGRLHAIVGGAPTCGGEAENADALAMVSGGTYGRLCPLEVDDMLDAVSVPLAACTFNLPGGDPDAIGEIELFTNTSSTLLERVSQPSDCPGTVNGALLTGGDGPPQLQLCPETCREYQEITLDQPLGGVRFYPAECF